MSVSSWENHILAEHVHTFFHIFDLTRLASVAASCFIVYATSSRIQLLVMGTTVAVSASLAWNLVNPKLLVTN